MTWRVSQRRKVYCSAADKSDQAVGSGVKDKPLEGFAKTTCYVSLQWAPCPQHALLTEKCLVCLTRTVIISHLSECRHLEGRRPSVGPHGDVVDGLIIGKSDRQDDFGI